MAGNSETAPRIHVSTVEAEWRGFDALPKELREALREAKQDYPSDVVLEDYLQRMDYESAEEFFNPPSSGERKRRAIRGIMDNIRFLDARYTAEYRDELLGQTVRIR